MFDLPKQLAQELHERLSHLPKPSFDGQMLRQLADAAVEKCQLVSREEFDAQAAVLLRTRQKLEALEAQVALLEARLSETEAPPAA